MARHPPRLSRKPYRREPRKRFTVFCEGKNTEPTYFRAIAKMYASAMVVVETVGGAGEPGALARAAIERAAESRRRRKKTADSFEENDEVWAVFDRDEHPNFSAAVAACAGAGVPVGRSNPCFEAWLILHIADYNRPDHRHDCQSYFKTLHPEYGLEHRKIPNCESLVTTVEIAEQRAERQLRDRNDEGSPFSAPSTTVGFLTKAIREASAKSKK